ncbi:hypothetical protein LP417_23725 [Polaromonas sp. P1-6]|nr:hypothetical protein LP417_23725 [Polaromonas sp. P1-6]
MAAPSGSYAVPIPLVQTLLARLLAEPGEEFPQGGMAASFRWRRDAPLITGLNELI